MKPFHVMLGVAIAATVTGLIAAFRNSGSSLSPLRAKIVSIAKGAVGMTASGDPTAFEDFLGGPGEAANVKHDMALYPKVSTCGLVARAILRMAGFTDASFHAPYQNGTAISALRNLAIKLGAWVEGKPGLLPEPGDVVMGDVDKPTGHVWTITSVDPATMSFTSVDGGVVDIGGHQSVAARTRKWTIQGDKIIDHPSIGNVHVITGWVNVEKLAQAEAA
jgi:hypothetical protein